VVGMEAIIVNTWPTRSTPDVVQSIPFTPMMPITRAVELLKTVRSIPQPVNTPLPLSAILQYPRYYLISFNGYLVIKGIRRDLRPTKWHAVFDVDNVIEHGYWHSKIIDDILSVLEPLAK
jgi:hypothetical protein